METILTPDNSSWTTRMFSRHTKSIWRLVNVDLRRVDDMYVQAANDVIVVVFISQICVLPEYYMKTPLINALVDRIASPSVVLIVG